MCADDIIKNAYDAMEYSREDAKTIVDAIVKTPDSKKYYSRRELLTDLATMPPHPAIAQAMRDINSLNTLENRLTFLYAMNTDKTYKQAIVDALMILNAIDP